MCDNQTEQENTLISAQNHGTLLLMVSWSLASLLVIAAAARTVARYRSEHLRRLPWIDDLIIFTAFFCALGSTVVNTIAVSFGFGKTKCLLSDGNVKQIELMIFISTILFIVTVSITKSSALLFIYRLAETAKQKASVIVTGILVLLWTIGILVGMVFQCELPTPWNVWTGKCIPVAPFWMTLIVVDALLDTAILVLSIYSVWKLRESYLQKTLGTLLLSPRLILIAASIVRLVYLQQAFDQDADPTLKSIPFVITTQGQTTLAVLIICILCLKPYSHHRDPNSHNLKPTSRHSKHWSGTTIGATPYESYDSFGVSIPVIKEPLPSIQASMSTPKPPFASMSSLRTDVLLPDKPTQKRSPIPPPRPPPPPESQRPDLSMFYRRMSLRRPLGGYVAPR